MLTFAFFEGNYHDVVVINLTNGPLGPFLGTHTSFPGKQYYLKTSKLNVRLCARFPVAHQTVFTKYTRSDWSISGPYSIGEFLCGLHNVCSQGSSDLLCGLHKVCSHSLCRRAKARSVSNSLLPYGGIIYFINSFDYPSFLCFNSPPMQHQFL